MNKPDHFSDARVEFWRRTLVLPEGRVIQVVLLIRDEDQRPIKAPFWRKKEASIIGVDVDGNFFLRLSNGAVSLWEHQAQKDIPVAPSVQEFARRLTEE